MKNDFFSVIKWIVVSTVESGVKHFELNISSGLLLQRMFGIDTPNAHTWPLASDCFMSLHIWFCSEFSFKWNAWRDCLCNIFGRSFAIQPSFALDYIRINKNIPTTYLCVNLSSGKTTVLRKWPTRRKWFFILKRLPLMASSAFRIAHSKLLPYCVTSIPLF